MGFLAGVFVVLGLVLLVAYFKTGSKLDLSNATQHHGVSESATVTAVHRSFHHHGSGASGDYTSTIDVSLSHPVSGATTSVVHYDDYSIKSIGDVVKVKVNTSAPSYSEYPGAPMETASGHFALLIGVGAMWIIAAVAGLATRKRILRRRNATTATNAI